MRLTQALGKGTGLLGFGGMGNSGRDSRALLAHALDIPVDRLILHADREISAAEMEAYEALLHRRLDHEPVSRIVGHRLFWGMDFQIGPQVLDPRPETETLVAAALETPMPRRLLDLGTGSGAIAVSLLAQWPESVAVATDLSAGALEVARANAERHGVADRLALIETDWFAGLDGSFELIVSNPPYIAAAEMAGLDPEVRDHDPEMSLTPGGDGLDAYRAIAAGLAAHLAPGGRVLLEIGPTQGAAVVELLEAAGLRAVTVLPDLDGRDRVISALAP